jgi:hypothetical protein
VREYGIAVMDLSGSRQLPMELPMHNARPLHRVHRRVLLLGLSLVACDPAKLGTLDSETNGSSGDDSDPSATASDDAGSQSGPVTGATSSASTDGDDAETSPVDEGGTFPDVGDGATTAPVDPTDDPTGDPTGPFGEACDVFLQDCPDGEKCNPWANDGGDGWNADGCFPVEGNPQQVGEACLVEGSGTSGIDNCDIGSMCWGVDSETLTGTCVALCGGTPDDPACSSPSTSCALLNDGVLPLCLPICDPLLQDCAEGEGCYPVDEVFHCFPDGSGEAGLFGDACDFIGQCDPGLMCANNVPSIPGCSEDQADCCVPYCDLSVPPSCPGDLTCAPFYDEGQAPPGFEDVGFCS